MCALALRRRNRQFKLIHVKTECKNVTCFFPFRRCISRSFYTLCWLIVNSVTNYIQQICSIPIHCQSAPPASLSKIFYWMTYVNGPAFYLSICLIILLISHFLQHVWETMNSQSQFLPQSSSHIFHFSCRTAHNIPLQDCRGLNWPFMLKSLEGVNVWLMVFLWGLL